jgi:tetratricopeptide (TPR) repeat protein
MKHSSPSVRIFLCFVLLLVTSFTLAAQSDEDKAKEIIVKALTLYQQQRYAEAVPYMEILADAMADSPEIHFAYGVCLIGKSKQISNTEEAKQLSAKALEQFLRAKQLGIKDPQNESFIALLTGKAAASPTSPTYSTNKEADQLMMEGENYFAQSKYDEAVKKFEKALALDPKIYRAALSAGDCYTAQGDWNNAEKWYQKGIAIDPNRETAYRYSATPLMKQGKYDLARERYVEALITEPYSDLARRGISQWADATGAKLGHPKLNVPDVTFDSNGTASTGAVIDANDPSSRPWLAYIATRQSWRKQKFAEAFPKESAYRHSLQEETEALRSVIKAAEGSKTANPQLQVLAKIDSEGLLEAFILMALADEGIAADHAEFLKTNRPKLRQYVANYVIRK